MVSIVFKAVYFFLAVFALPHVLAAPGAAAPDLSRRSVEDETLSAHFMVRRNLLNPRLEWDGKLGARASSRVASCNRKGPDNTLGGSSNGYPYLPRVLTLEPIENLSNSNSITDAVLSWANGNSDTRENKQVLSENTTKVGCAIGNCPDGKFVVCAYNGTPSISILPEANSHGFFFFQPCKVSKREANGPHPRFAVHMHMPIVQVNQFLLPRLSSFSIDSPDFIRNSRNIYTHFKRILVADFLHHLRTSHIAHHVGESLRSDVETTHGPSRLFSSEGAMGS